MINYTINHLQNINEYLIYRNDVFMGSTKTLDEANLIIAECKEIDKVVES